MPEELLIVIGTEHAHEIALDLWRGGLHFVPFSLTSLQLELSFFAGCFCLSTSPPPLDNVSSQVQDVKFGYYSKLSSAVRLMLTMSFSCALKHGLDMLTWSEMRVFQKLEH